jgi:DNA repair protein RecO (recombination protein O)
VLYSERSEEYVAIHTTEAIVLRTWPLRQTSQINAFYTREFGKISGLLKGIKSYSSRYGSRLEAFSHNRILFYERPKSGLHLVTQCDLIERFGAIREDLLKTSYASFFLELVDGFTEINDKNEKLFSLLLFALKAIEQDNDLEKSAIIFGIMALKISGFKPHLDWCLRCSREISRAARFSSRHGGLLCLRCGAEDKFSLPVSKGTISSIIYIENSVFGTIFSSRFQLSRKIKQELKKILKNFIEFHLGKALKTLRFIEGLKVKSSVDKM